MMSDNKVKHIAGLVSWAAIHTYFLAFHFSWGNLAVLAVALIFLLFTTVIGKKHDETHFVWTTGNLIGTSFAVLLGYYVITAIIPAFKIPENVDFAGLLTVLGKQFEILLERSAFEISFQGITSYVFLIIAVLSFFGSKWHKHPIFSIMLKYLWTGCLFAALIDSNYHSKEILFLYFACMLIFVACDILIYQHDGSCNKSGKRWYNILNVLLVFVLALEPNGLAVFTQNGFIEYYFITCGFKWYTALYILIALIATGFFMILGYDEKDAKTNTDISIFWNAIWILISLFFMTRFYVGYWWIVALAYIICVAVTLIPLCPTKVDGNEKLSGWDIGFLPIVSIATIITVIAGHYGRLLITWAFIGGAILILDQFLRRNKNDVWWKDARFYSIVLLTIGVIAAISLWGFNRLTYNFLVLLGMLAVSLAFVWVVSCDSGLFAKRNPLVQTLTVILFAILCICLCSKNDGKIKIAPDDSGTVAVNVVSTRKEREIVTVEYYWLEDFLHVNGKQESFPKEVILEDKVIPEEDGRLRVIVTDNYGAQTEQIYWVHVSQYSEKTN